MWTITSWRHKNFEILHLNDKQKTLHHCLTFLSPKHSYVLYQVGAPDNKISLVPEDSISQSPIYIHTGLHHWRFNQMASDRRDAWTITSQTTGFLLPLNNLPCSHPGAYLRAPKPVRKCVGGGHSVTLWLSIDQGHNFHDHYTTEGDRKHLQKWSGAYVGAAHP